MPSQASYSGVLKRVIEEVIAPGATEVDSTGSFPQKQMGAALLEGLLTWGFAWFLVFGEVVSYRRG